MTTYAFYLIYIIFSFVVLDVIISIKYIQSSANNIEEYIRIEVKRNNINTLIKRLEYAYEDKSNIVISYEYCLDDHEIEYIKNMCRIPGFILDFKHINENTTKISIHKKT